MANRWWRKYAASSYWRSMSSGGQFGAENCVVRFRWSPASIPRSRAIAAARSESSMNTMALTEEMVPRRSTRELARWYGDPAPIVGVHNEKTGATSVAAQAWRFAHLVRTQRRSPSHGHRSVAESSEAALLRTLQPCLEPGRLFRHGEGRLRHESYYVAPDSRASTDESRHERERNAERPATKHERLDSE